MTPPLAEARRLFSLDPDVTYLENAAVTPIPLPVEAAGTEGFAAKARPWARDRAAAELEVERARALAGRVIGASADDIAITSSVGHGLAIAAANLPCVAGERVLVMAGDHSSQALAWARFAREHGAVLETVERPADGDWEAALLARVRRPGPRIAVAALARVIWNEGALVALDSICRELRAAGGAVVLDLTQSAGIVPVDVKRLDADFVAFPTYKWLLGPYSVAFLYVAERWQEARPLEESGHNRELDDQGPAADPGLAPYTRGARRFDRGERDNFSGLPAAAAGLRLIVDWGVPAIQSHLQSLMTRLTGQLAAAGFGLLPPALQSPHILGLRGLPDDTVQRCRALGVWVSQRHGLVRIGLHVFNTPGEIDRCVRALVAIRATA